MCRIQIRHGNHSRNGVIRGDVTTWKEYRINNRCRVFNTLVVALMEEPAPIASVDVTVHSIVSPYKNGTVSVSETSELVTPATIQAYVTVGVSPSRSDAVASQNIEVVSAVTS